MSKHLPRHLVGLAVFIGAVIATMALHRVLWTFEMSIASSFMESDGTIPHPVFYVTTVSFLQAAYLTLSILILSLILEKLFGMRFIQGAKHLVLLFLCLGVVIVFWERLIEVPLYYSLSNLLDRFILPGNHDQDAPFFVLSHEILSSFIRLLGLSIQYMAFALSAVFAKQLRNQ